MRMSEPGGGFLRKNDPANGQWYSRDVAAIAQAQGLSRPAPYFIDQGVPASNPAYVRAEAGTEVLRPGMTVIRFPNSHLVYALTCGAGIMVMGAAWPVRRHDKAVAKS
jgi:surfeit locus 1 family protein